MLDIDLLKTFLEVNKTRHFGKAADSLCLTPAAVSARVKQLESILGVNLFLRNRNNIQLTQEGERLVPHAETMLIAWARARQEVALQVEQSQQLNIGATYGLWNFALQEKLAEINRSLPQLSLRAEAYTHEVLVKNLLEKTIDLALVYEPPTLVDFTATKIGQLQLVFATTQTQLPAKKLFESGYVYVDWGTGFELFHAKRFGEAAPAILHTNMSTIAADFIIHTPGSAYLPRSVVESLSDKNVKLVKSLPHFNRPIYALFRSGQQEQAWFTDVVDILRNLSV